MVVFILVVHHVKVDFLLWEEKAVKFRMGYLNYQ